MEKGETRGYLYELPLSFLLFELWRQKRNGRLKLNQADKEKIFSLREGDIAVESAAFDANDFFTVLVERKAIDSTSLQNCRAHAEKERMSLIKACMDLHLASPPQLWTLIREYSLAEIYPLFDWDNAEYSFLSQPTPEKDRILCRLPTLDLILQGTRQMTNHSLIQSRLPAKESLLQALFPPHLSQLTFLPHEDYLLRMMTSQPSMRTVYEQSELISSETHRILFAFLSLGLFSTPQTAGKGPTVHNFSQAELHRILTAFNRKWMYVFKYITKEIGPVATNILEKSLQESKSRHSPLFQNVKLQPDGQIDTSSVLRGKFNFSSQHTKQNLLIGLNDILVAEVLAVKKTLGAEHEAILVRNLEKIKS